MTPEIAWALLGVALIILEIATGTFVVLFFGIAALLVSLIMYLSGLDQRTAEVLIFALLGLAGTLSLRKKFLSSFKSSKEFQIDEFKKIKLTQDIPARGEGRVFYQGSPWTAINDSAQALSAGTQAVIVRTEGVKLFLQPEDAHL